MATTRHKRGDFKFRFAKPSKRPWIPRSRRWPEGTPRFVRERLHHAAARAKVKGVPFDLTPETLPPLPDACPVFGTPFGTGRHAPSLDRIDPELGYVAGNVQWLSLQANAMKSNATPDMLRRFAEWVLAK